MAKTTCSQILEKARRRVERRLAKQFVAHATLAKRIELVARGTSNRAAARFLMAATLAKLDQPNIDIRKPFIQGYDDKHKADAYSGRHYDERFVFEFITRHKLPCSSTTAFLTPAFRTKNVVLDVNQKLRGRPPELYDALLQILDDIQSQRASPANVLCELIRLLIIERDERFNRIETLKRGLKNQSDELPLSSEDTVQLIEQHLALKHTARLPVLVVAAAYQAASENLGERVLRLNAHTAADKQTGSIGDVEITLLGDNEVVTSYEMKDKAITLGDIDIAVQKIVEGSRVQNYIFITTAPVDQSVRAYAVRQYRELGGVETAILDCVGFLRHFLHLFHRLRTDFLDVYQELVLSQPESAVSQALKEAFLALRNAAQATE